jgi:adenylate kinase
MLNIALFGPPGAGKGTQSKKLIEKYNLTYVATGDLLRKEIAEGTALGIEAKNLIEKGRLVPDDMILQIIEKTQSTPIPIRMAFCSMVFSKNLHTGLYSRRFTHAYAY